MFLSIIDVIIFEASVLKTIKLVFFTPNQVQSSLIYYNFILDKSKVSTNISAKHKVSDNAFYFSDAFVTLKWIWASIATPPYSLPSISWPDDESFKKVVNVLNADAEVLKRQKERIKRISEPRNWPYDE